MPAIAPKNIWKVTRKTTAGYRGFVLALLAAAMLNISGCGILFHEPPPNSDDLLMQDGIEAFNDGSYKDAIEVFQKVKDRFPFSPHVILAEQKIADAHYLRQEYPEAVYAYEDFEKLHPRNPIIPYINFQIGMCYFEQMAAIDQDQEYTRKAAAEFDRLIKTHPDSVYAIRAENKLNECLKRLSQYEMYVGRLYFRQKHYAAAKARFQGVVYNFPDQGEYREALTYIARCDAELQTKSEVPSVQGGTSGGSIPSE
ncbi:MAG: outer membrane protein assembly factor BamD [Deltaproteobacteria bacterium]|nr:outer membrane protein assembly factor BamD [Deltaproteobacteria bacterium]